MYPETLFYLFFHKMKKDFQIAFLSCFFKSLRNLLILLYSQSLQMTQKKCLPWLFFIFCIHLHYLLSDNKRKYMKRLSFSQLCFDRWWRVLPTSKCCQSKTNLRPSSRRITDGDRWKLLHKRMTVFSLTAASGMPG